MDHAKFFAAVRSSLFGNRLSQQAVDGLGALLAAFDTYGDGDRQKLAYILGTAFHETDRFSTLEEYASGEAYEGRQSLGNTQSGDGKRFKGRGFVQVTGRRNYADWSKRLGVDLVGSPELAEQPSIAARICVDGMMKGTFTGRKLDQYINSGNADFNGARRIVNGTDKAEMIAGYAMKFDKALIASEFGTVAAAFDSVPVPTPAPRPIASSPIAAAGGMPAVMGSVSKAVGAAKGAAKGSAVLPAIALIAPKLGILPAWMFEPEYLAAVLLIGGVASAALWAFISTYKAPANEA